MNYAIRNENGSLIASISGADANMIFRDGHGYFREATFSTGKATVFEITEDAVFGIRDVRLYLWKGYRICPN